MASRAFLAGLSLIFAQKLYRPFVIGGSGLYPMGAWQEKRHPFPAGGHIRYAVGLYGAKEYYNRQGRLGWFPFFQLIQWSLNQQSFFSSFVSQETISSLRSRSPLSNIGGLGVVYRFPLKTGLWCAFSGDLRIAYVSYPSWELLLKSGEVLRILIESNSYIGCAVSPTLWVDLLQNKKTLFGISMSYPLLWGKPSFFTYSLLRDTLQLQSERRSYSLSPSWIELRLQISFLP
ncbi:MAG: hypothetical protein RMK19_03995 [Bacteroidia bacterium]|nr:hypothetical protein [Bacteroidia bacterium]MDW8015153.1 hypothetical protein [Bacteroidia bacterium]